MSPLSSSPSDHELTPGENSRLIVLYPHLFQKTLSEITYTPAELLTLEGSDKSVGPYDCAHAYLTMNGATDSELEDIMNAVFGYYIPGIR